MKLVSSSFDRKGALLRDANVIQTFVNIFRRL